MTETMKAVDIKNGKGDISALFINEIPMPKPKPADAIVRIKAFGLNRMDMMQREGRYPVPPQAPKTLGVEFSGVVWKVAEQGERDFKEGDEVFGLAYGGAYAEYIAVSTHMLVHKPKQLSWAQAAGVPECWISATQALYLVGEYAPGKTVLWHAGASGVSIAGIQLARSDGAAAVYATAGSDEKCNFIVKELGATAAFNYKTQNWAEEIKKATGGKGVDLIVDFVGADYFAGNLDVAARDARIVSLAFLSGSKLPAGIDISTFLYKRLRYEGSSLRSRDEKYQGKLRDMLVEHALPRFCNEEYKVFIEKTFPWEQIADAHRLMEANTSKGKIVCTIDWQ